MSDVRDIIGTAVAAFLVGVGVTSLAVSRSVEPPAPVVVKEAPAACMAAMDTVNDTLVATGHLIAAVNRVGPLVADAYAAGLAGRDPMIERVTNLNLDIRKAHKAAAGLPDLYVKQAARCRAYREDTDE